ncbi:MAG: phosphoribosylformylglycinamidine synthase subunit PurQ [Gemmatimonadota bacterium]|nr:phosphoribosylformylglycinamidine synthase subunit PurQ [Gemmatimonadota bacterium]
MKFGIVRFPGSNCDADVHRAVTEGLGEEATYLWHKSHDLEGADVVVLPGGFSYGDYLRGGAIARFSPIMREVIDFAKAGGLTLGICNGFQVLCEARLLPGALVRNRSLRFRCLPVGLRVENAGTAFTSDYEEGRLIDIPIAHGQGQYVARPETLDRLEAEGRVVFRYVDADGHPTDAANPNGSARNIAGIINETGNILGLMPHPERHSLAVLGSTDGLGVFTSLREAVARGAPRPAGAADPRPDVPADAGDAFDSSTRTIGVEA